MYEHGERPWSVHYGPGVPTQIDIPDEPITAGLERAAQKWPDRIATDFLGATATYAETERAVRRAMVVLRDLGVKAGDKVALVLPNSPSHLVAYHAVLRLGAVVVDLNPTYTQAELTHLLADCGAEYALVWHKAVETVLAARGETRVKVVSVDISRDLPTSAQLLLKLPVKAAREKRDALRGSVPSDILDWHTLVKKARGEVAAAEVHADDLALLQYTGGTTGTPKAAMLTHRNLVANVVHGQAWAHFRDGEETVYGVLPFFHAFGLTFCLNLPGYIGATLVMFPNFDPAAVLAAFDRRPATFMAGVAPMFDRIAIAAETAKNPPTAGLRQVRLGFAGAMPIPTSTVERWERLTGGLLIEGYGMTECAPIALGNPCAPTRRPGTLGVPFPNTDMKIVDIDDHTHEVTPDENGHRRGELLVRGPQVFLGYLNRPEETAHQLLEGGWLRTGDVVEVDETGWVTLVDRVKEMIIVGGFKVYPSTVEDHLRLMPGIADVAVVGVRTIAGDDQVLAAFVLEEGADAPSLDEVRAHGETRLARYALPRRVEILKDLPRSQIGKVMRRQVQKLFSHDD
ncbi:AMP-binding protein [Aeromicrobium duanguangcaii]|uniref:AMP-binding protein n=1 Tax=Aeromicrobium duanguangcaii TaxID=2968086 RepID=A0ABY5KGG7_9ACTN|nr:AMP-binding protein [Aeromicrobium duanguangcaii]MCD9153350.1 AMP-binding protein [Aeromicrobium duanguangcaii]UUI69557.1 AMP-binding protein [Aeromicrobium duanguangcaii]